MNMKILKYKSIIEAANTRNVFIESFKKIFCFGGPYITLTFKCFPFGNKSRANTLSAQCLERHFGYYTLSFFKCRI